MVFPTFNVSQLNSNTTTYGTTLKQFNGNISKINDHITHDINIDNNKNVSTLVLEVNNTHFITSLALHYVLHNNSIPHIINSIQCYNQLYDLWYDIKYICNDINNNDNNNDFTKTMVGTSHSLRTHRSQQSMADNTMQFTLNSTGDDNEHSIDIRYIHTNITINATVANKIRIVMQGNILQYVDSPVSNNTLSDISSIDCTNNTLNNLSSIQHNTSLHNHKHNIPLLSLPSADLNHTNTNGSQPSPTGVDSIKFDLYGYNCSQSIQSQYILHLLSLQHQSHTKLHDTTDILYKYNLIDCIAVHELLTITLYNNHNCIQSYDMIQRCVEHIHTLIQYIQDDEISTGLIGESIIEQCTYYSELMSLYCLQYCTVQDKSAYEYKQQLILYRTVTAYTQLMQLQSNTNTETIVNELNECVDHDSNIHLLHPHLLNMLLYQLQRVQQIHTVLYSSTLTVFNMLFNTLLQNNTTSMTSVLHAVLQLVTNTQHTEHNDLKLQLLHKCVAHVHRLNGNTAMQCINHTTIAVCNYNITDEHTSTIMQQLLTLLHILCQHIQHDIGGIVQYDTYIDNIFNTVLQYDLWSILLQCMKSSTPAISESAEQCYTVLSEHCSRSCALYLCELNTPNNTNNSISELYTKLVQQYIDWVQQCAVNESDEPEHSVQSSTSVINPSAIQSITLTQLYHFVDTLNRSDIIEYTRNMAIYKQLIDLTNTLSYWVEQHINTTQLVNGAHTYMLFVTHKLLCNTLSMHCATVQPDHLSHQPICLVRLQYDESVATPIDVHTIHIDTILNVVDQQLHSRSPVIDSLKLLYVIINTEYNIITPSNVAESTQNILQHIYTQLCCWLPLYVRDDLFTLLITCINTVFDNQLNNRQINHTIEVLCDKNTVRTSSYTQLRSAFIYAVVQHSTTDSIYGMLIQYCTVPIANRNTAQTIEHMNLMLHTIQSIPTERAIEFTSVQLDDVTSLCTQLITHSHQSIQLHGIFITAALQQCCHQSHTNTFNRLYQDVIAKYQSNVLLTYHIIPCIATSMQRTDDRSMMTQYCTLLTELLCTTTDAQLIHMISHVLLILCQQLVQHNQPEHNLAITQCIDKLIPSTHVLLVMKLICIVLVCTPSYTTDNTSSMFDAILNHANDKKKSIINEAEPNSLPAYLHDISTTVQQYSVDSIEYIRYTFCDLHTVSNMNDDIILVLNRQADVLSLIQFVTSHKYNTNIHIRTLALHVLKYYPHQSIQFKYTDVLHNALHSHCKQSVAAPYNNDNINSTSLPMNTAQFDGTSMDHDFNVYTCTGIEQCIRYIHERYMLQSNVSQSMVVTQNISNVELCIDDNDINLLAQNIDTIDDILIDTGDEDIQHGYDDNDIIESKQNIPELQQCLSPPHHELKQQSTNTRQRPQSAGTRQQTLLRSTSPPLLNRNYSNILAIPQLDTITQTRSNRADSNDDDEFVVMSQLSPHDIESSQVVYQWPLSNDRYPISNHGNDMSSSDSETFDLDSGSDNDNIISDDDIDVDVQQNNSTSQHLNTAHSNDSSHGDDYAVNDSTQHSLLDGISISTIQDTPTPIRHNHDLTQNTPITNELIQPLQFNNSIVFTKPNAVRISHPVSPRIQLFDEYNRPRHTSLDYNNQSTDPLHNDVMSPTLLPLQYPLSSPPPPMTIAQRSTTADFLVVTRSTPLSSPSSPPDNYIDESSISNDTTQIRSILTPLKLIDNQRSLSLPSDTKLTSNMNLNTNELFDSPDKYHDKILTATPLKRIALLKQGLNEINSRLSPHKRVV